MNCPNCGEYVEEGRFCTNCGTELTAENVSIENQKSDEVSHKPAQQEVQNTSQTAVEEKNGGVDIADYYTRIIKKPSQAIEATANDIIPGIITLIVFALLVGSQSYYLMNEMSGGYISASFSDDFLVPLLRFALVIVAVIALTFWGLKFTEDELSFQDVFAKYTALLIPFVLLFALGFILEVISLPSAPTAIMGVASNAPLLFIPTLIILNSRKKEYDLVYILISIFALAYIIRVLLMDALLSMFS